MSDERDLSGPGQGRAIRDLLQSLFACELLRPSMPLWLYFAWISDIEVIDNSARRFSALSPDWPAAAVRLSTVLDTLLSRGGRVNLLLREDTHNDRFIDMVQRLRRERGAERMRFCVRPNFHEKGMLGDGYVLSGSMNLTMRGLSVNDEHVILRRDPKIVAQRRIELENKWAAQLQ